MSNKSNNIIQKISEIRAKNNKNWMAILQLAFDLAPKRTGKIMKEIAECDQEITKLTKKLTELENESDE